MLALLPAIMASAQKNTPQSYIEQFKDDAIRIMHETGVPASIVLTRCHARKRLRKQQAGEKSK